MPRLLHFVVVALLALPAPSPGHDAPEPTLVAAWRITERIGEVSVDLEGEIERADYDAWRAFHQLPDTPETLRDRIYVDSMAAAARARGAEQEPRLLFELEILRQSLLIPALRAHLTQDVPVADEEVEALLRERPDAFEQPRKLKLRQLHKTRRPDAEKDAREELETLRQRLLNVPAATRVDVFAALARTESDSQTRFQDGRLGILAPDELPPVAADAVRTLETGGISEIVDLGEGWSIFYCEEVREARRPPLEEKREKARHALRRRRGLDLWDQTRKEIFEAASPRVQATPPPGASPSATPWVALEAPGYRLLGAELAELVPLRLPKKTLADLAPPQVEAFLRIWAADVLVARRAAELGLDKDPATVDTLRWRRLAAQLVRRVDARLVEPNEDDLRRRHAADAARHVEPPTFDLAMIHFGAVDGPDAPQRIETARDVLRRIDAGDLTFEDAARRYSTLPSAATGGRLERVPSQQIAGWGPDMVRAFRALRPGERSELIRTDTGLILLELRAEHPGRLLTFEEAAPRIAAKLRRERVAELESTIRRERLELLEIEAAQKTD